MKDGNIEMPASVPRGPQKPSLLANTVHGWLAELRVPPQRLEAYTTLLTPDECERAARFHFDRDRNRYIAGRGMLRILLGRYLNAPAAEIAIHYNEFGKPFLPGSELRFNLAHSADQVIYAFSLEGEVGVDIEAERELSDAVAISERYFSPRERETLRSLPEELRTAAFFRCWARKEAFIKAVGEGLSYPLDVFDVTLGPDAPPRLLSIRGSDEEARHWSLFSPAVPLGYHSALAIRGRPRQLQVWTYEE